MTIRNVVVLGHGTMGSGAAALFGAAGLRTIVVARTLDKAKAGCTRADALAKRACGLATATYDELARAVEDADLILEAVSEDLDTKRQVYDAIDQLRGPRTIVATVSSGLSIAELSAGRSAGFASHFLGVHLFNPPTMIAGCELIPHRGTDDAVIVRIRELLASLGREVVETADTPAFAGNRIGFKVLNEVAQLAEEHGVAYMDRLLGPHSGRALAPLATIDLVGWDVHKAIVDNLWARTHDESHDAFRLPSYMQRGIDRGHLGRKTKDKGGFFRLDGKTKLALDPATGDYQPIDAMTLPALQFIDRMSAALRVGDHVAAMGVLCNAAGPDAELLRRVLLGYVSYALGRVGEVVACSRDVDRIMASGFLWAPPGMLVDAIGAARTIELLEGMHLPVPPVIADAARLDVSLCPEPGDSSKFFVVAA